MKHLRIEAAILALSIVLLGIFFRLAIGDFINKDRSVVVKGLSEQQVDADLVVWPLMYKEVGNDPAMMYETIERKNTEILAFLTQNGIKREEISIKPTTVSDRKANAYSEYTGMERYTASSILTVTSSNVTTVRRLMQRQSELMKRGIAFTSEEYGSNQVEFKYTRLNDIKPKMIEEATKNARTTADKFAKDSDSRLGKIKTAQQGQFSIENRDPTTPHIKTVRVVTTIEYYLED